MSKVRKSLSSPEILRRDPYAFVDRHHDPRNVHLTDILFARERGSPSSSEEIMRDLLPVSESLVISRSSSSSEESLWDLFPLYESPASSRSLSPWSSAFRERGSEAELSGSSIPHLPTFWDHLSPVRTQGPWRFGTEEDPSDEERSEYFVEIWETNKHLEFANFSIHNHFIILRKIHPFRRFTTR